MDAEASLHIRPTINSLCKFLYQVVQKLSDIRRRRHNQENKKIKSIFAHLQQSKCAQEFCSHYPTTNAQ